MLDWDDLRFALAIARNNGLAGAARALRVDSSTVFRHLNGLEARQAAISYAYAFADRMFSIGTTGKYIQGAAYTGTTNISGAQMSSETNGSMCHSVCDQKAPNMPSITKSP